jgi:hypothetical protein
MQEQIKFLEYRIQALEKELEKLNEIVKQQNNYLLGETEQTN